MRLPSLEDAARFISLSLIFQTPLTSTDVSKQSLLSNTELPGGSPLRLCDVSRSTDLFNITAVELTHQPVHIDDWLLIRIYGTFQDTIKPNSSMILRADCGSHCEEYGNPPGERPGANMPADFCEHTDIMQPSSGKKKNETCPPEKGWALLTQELYVWPMLFGVPGWYNFTLDVKTADDDRIFCITAEVCLRWEKEDKNKGYPPGPWTNCSWPR